MFSLVQDDEEEAARLVAIGAGRVSGAAAPVARRVKNRQTVFASATVPQHNHFIKQCAQVCNRETYFFSTECRLVGPAAAEFVRCTLQWVL